MAMNPTALNAAPAPFVSTPEILSPQQFKTDFLDLKFDIQKSAVSSSKPFCVVISDAHGQPEAQESILTLIEWLRNVSPETVYLIEGASGELNIDGFEGPFDSAKKQEVVGKWFSRGDLTPAEASFILHPKKRKIFGLEQMTRYADHVKTYWMVQANERRANGILDRIFRDLSKQINSEIEPGITHLRSFDAFLAAAAQNPKNVVDLWKKTAERRPELFLNFENTYPALHRLFNALDKTSEAFNKEFSRQITHPEFISKLEEEYSRFYESAVAMLMRITQAAQSEKHSGFKIWLLEDSLRGLFSLRLSPKSWEALKRHESKNFPEGLMRQMSYHTSQLSAEDRRFLQTAFKKAVHFYECAEERDQIFKQQFLKYQQQFSSARSFVMIMGGFHTDQFRSFLETQKFPHLVLRPKMNQPAESFYELRMQQLAENQTSTVVAPLVLAESEYARAELRVTPRRDRLLNELRAAAALRSELRKPGMPVPAWALRRRALGRFARSLMAGLMTVSLFLACNAPQADFEPKVPAELRANDKPIAAKTVLVNMRNLKKQLAESNPVKAARLDVVIAYMDYLKTLPEFANWDLGAEFSTSVDKVIGSKISGRVSRKGQILRQKMDELVQAVIGKTTEVTEANVSDPKVAALASSIYGQFGGFLSSQLSSPENPEAVDYGWKWADDIGVSLGIASSPGVSTLDQLPIEGMDEDDWRNLIPLSSIETPFGLSIGTSSGNILTGSQTEQAAANLIRAVFSYRRILRDQAIQFANLHEALELSQRELLRLVLNAHLLQLQYAQFTSDDYKKHATRTSLASRLREIRHQIEVQRINVTLFDATLKLLFQQSPQDLRSWVMRTVKPAIFNTRFTDFPEKFEGTFPPVDFFQYDPASNSWYLPPENIGRLLQSIGDQNRWGEFVMIDPAQSAWYKDWAAAVAASPDQPADDSAQALNAVQSIITHFNGNSDTVDLKFSIAFDEQAIRQILTQLHPEVNFGVGTGFTLPGIDNKSQVKTFQLNLPLTLVVRIPIGTKNTRLSIEQVRAGVEKTRLAILEAIKNYLDLLDTYRQNFLQSGIRLNALGEQQVRAVNALRHLAANSARYTSDGKTVPFDVAREFFPLLTDFVNSRINRSVEDIQKFHLGLRMSLLAADSIPGTNQVQRSNFFAPQNFAPTMRKTVIEGKDVPLPEVEQEESAPSRTGRSELRPTTYVSGTPFRTGRSELRTTVTKPYGADQRKAFGIAVREIANRNRSAIPESGEVTFRGIRLTFARGKDNAWFLKLAKLPPNVRLESVPAMLEYWLLWQSSANVREPSRRFYRAAILAVQYLLDGASKNKTALSSWSGYGSDIAAKVIFGAFQSLSIHNDIGSISEDAIRQAISSELAKLGRRGKTVYLREENLFLQTPAAAPQQTLRVVPKAQRPTTPHLQRPLRRPFQLSTAGSLALAAAIILGVFLLPVIHASFANMGTMQSTSINQNRAPPAPKILEKAVTLNPAPALILRIPKKFELNRLYAAKTQKGGYLSGADVNSVSAITAAALPETIHLTGSDSEIDFKTALQKAQDIAQEYQELVLKWAPDEDKPTLSFDGNFAQYEKVIDAVRAAVFVNPSNDANFAWDKLFSEAELAFSQAKRAQSRLKLGEIAKSVYEIYLIRTYEALQKLIDELERFNQAQVVRFDKSGIAKPFQVDTKNRAVEQFKPDSFFTDVFLSDNEIRFFAALEIVVGLPDGKSVTIPSEKIHWLALDANAKRYRVYISGEELINVTFAKLRINPDVRKKIENKLTETDGRSRQTALLAMDMTSIGLPSDSFLRSQQDIRQVKEGDLLAEPVLDTDTEIRLTLLRRERARILKYIDIFKANLPVEGLTPEQQQYGFSEIDFEIRLTEIDSLIQQLEREQKRAPIQASSDGALFPVGHGGQIAAFPEYAVMNIAIPEGAAVLLESLIDPDRTLRAHVRSSHDGQNNSVVEFINPPSAVSGVESFLVTWEPAGISPDLKSELRRTNERAVGTLFELVSPNEPLAFGSEAPDSLEDVTNLARQRSEFVKLWNESKLAPQQTDNKFNSRVNAASAATILITDFSALSPQGFKVWSHFLPGSENLNWIVIADRETRQGILFRQFQSLVKAQGRHFQIASNPNQARSILNTAARIDSSQLVKWISSTAMPNLPTIDTGPEMKLMAAEFNSALYGEIETWFYQMFLSAEDITALQRSYQSVRVSMQNRWAVIHFNFAGLVRELANKEALSRSA